MLYQLSYRAAVMAKRRVALSGRKYSRRPRARNGAPTFHAFSLPAMPVRLLLLVLGLLTAAPLALAFARGDGQLALYAVPGAVLLAVALVFKPELDWAYYTRRPADLDAPVVKLLEAKRPRWYDELPEADRLRLRQRTHLTVLGLDFKPQTQEETELPGDFAALLAAQLARLTWRLAPKHAIPFPYENVVVYPHPFPSRQFPHDFHASELYDEDGVVLLSLHQALPGTLDPQEYFNVALYEWVRACMRAWGTTSADGLPTWEGALREMLGYEERWVREGIGLPAEAIDGAAVLQVLRLDFPSAFAKTYPSLAVVLADQLKPRESREA